MATEDVTLCTFSGKFGDAMWSLPAVRELHRAGQTVDFATMETFAAVHPLIARQPYVRQVFAIQGWHMQSDHCGALPRIPPTVPDGYSRVLHLCYTARPTTALIEHAPAVIGIPLQAPVLPFLEVAPVSPRRPYVAYAFNGTDMQPKLDTLKEVRLALPNVDFLDVGRLPFYEAARGIQGALFFFGCRSANWVIANGVNRPCLIVEPNAGRREFIFGCPYGREVMPDIGNTAAFVETAKVWGRGVL